MRWLTGTRHQISDVAADAASPVQALVLSKGSGLDITFLTTRIEMPRVQDQLGPIYERAEGIKAAYSTDRPSLPVGVSAPGSPGYADLIGGIVMPLVGGLEGDPYARLSWLIAATTALLAKSAHEIEPGMNGAQVRARVLANLLEHDIESNLVLVALAGQEGHLHPLYDARYRIERDGWVKLVAGARLAEMIVSATVQVKFGKPPSKEAAEGYRALQEGTVEYADCYRAGAVEGDIYTEVGRRFADLERAHALPGFAAAAYAHHMGGPTSPIGNRDYLVEKGGKHVIRAWTQFAINPVEPKANTKVELQGIVMPQGAPHVPDLSTFTPPALLTFREVVSKGGARATVADILQR